MFMQVLRAKVADEAGVRKAIDRWEEELRPGATGYLGSTAGLLDDGGFIVVARFESREAAQRNSDRPEQGEWFKEMSAQLSGEPEFLDIDNVDKWLDGGSDDAGFVQVMIGHSPDRDKLQEFTDEHQQELREMRPEIIGGLQGKFGDDGFVNVAYFKSEAAAREGEASEPPEAMREQANDFQRLMGDVTYYDLHEPILRSPN